MYIKTLAKFLVFANTHEKVRSTLKFWLEKLIYIDFHSFYSWKRPQNFCSEDNHENTSIVFHRIPQRRWHKSQKLWRWNRRLTETWTEKRLEHNFSSISIFFPVWLIFDDFLKSRISRQNFKKPWKMAKHLIDLKNEEKSCLKTWVQNANQNQKTEIIN